VEVNNPLRPSVASRKGDAVKAERRPDTPAKGVAGVNATF